VNKDLAAEDATCNKLKSKHEH